MIEEGVEMMLSSFAVYPIMEGDKIVGLSVENKSGRQAVLEKIVVDATGDADVAKRVGASTKWSGGNPGIGLFYALGDMDWECFQEAMENQGELSEVDRKWMEKVMNIELGYSTHGLDSLVPYARKAWESGSYKREYIFETVQFFKEYLPGFSKCYLHTIAPYLGARGGRWIDAEYPSTYPQKGGRAYRDWQKRCPTLSQFPSAIQHVVDRTSGRHRRSTVCQKRGRTARS